MGVIRIRVLLISDVECPALWDYYQPSRVEGVDLIRFIEDYELREREWEAERKTDMER